MKFKPLASPAPVEPGKPAARTAGAPEPTPVKETAGAKVAQNLLIHIPGEASGFYLFGIDILRPESGVVPGSSAVAVGVIALVLLVLVRRLANASRAVLLTTVGAFVLWMVVLDVGCLNLVLKEHGLGLGKLGAVLGLGYSAVITILANAGKLES